MLSAFIGGNYKITENPFTIGMLCLPSSGVFWKQVPHEKMSLNFCSTKSFASNSFVLQTMKSDHVK